MRRITLCVDALTPHLSGIGRYTWELCKGLSGHDGVDALTFYSGGRILKDPARLLRNGPQERARGRWQNWIDQRALRSSIVHAPNYFLPDFADSGIITVHDLSVFRYPETHPADRIAAFERGFLGSLARASHVITDTETIRRELIETYSVRPEDVTAVPLGIDSSFRTRPFDELAPALAVWGLKPQGYGLCVSTLEPRKRIGELLAAWRRLPHSLRDAYPLVLCGGAGWQNAALREEVDQAVAEGWLRHLGFVEENLLPYLYAGAALFAYPSIYEGFGLPPLEAMASGVPVMVSRHSCLPEVCGDAARYFDPNDATEFATALECNLSDASWRAEASQRGVERSGGFRWSRCVDETVAIYDAVGGSNRSSGDKARQAMSEASCSR